MTGQNGIEPISFFIQWMRESVHPSEDSPEGCRLHSFELEYFDAPAWTKVSVRRPDGKVFEVNNGGDLRKVGSTEVFTESAEPPLVDDPETATPAEIEAAIQAFQARFPEGEYRFIGKTKPLHPSCLMSRAHDHDVIQMVAERPQPVTVVTGQGAWKPELFLACLIIRAQL